MLHAAHHANASCTTHNSSNKNFDTRSIAAGSAYPSHVLPHHHREHLSPKDGHARPARRRLLASVTALGVRVAAETAAAGEVVTGPNLLFDYEDDLYEPSHDLRELAAAQLSSMFQVLARLSTAAAAAPQLNAASSCRACLYARRAESLGAPQIRLQRVACWPPSAPQPPAGAWSSSSSSESAHDAAQQQHSSSYEEMDELLTLHRPGWEHSSSNSSGSAAGCDTEASLCQEEMLLLPNSNMVVLPLAEAGVLVGLLVVEMTALPPQPSSNSHSGSSSSSSSSAAGSPWDPPSSSQMGLSDDALWCLRMAVPPLAKACAMDLRSALAGAQQEAQQRLARSLLIEARAPLKVLGTFGQMLAPRLRTELAGQPEPDMADGMVMQGQRLAGVIAELEAALRPLAGSRGSGPMQQLALPPAAAAAAEDAGQGYALDSFKDMADVWEEDVLQQQQQERELLQPNRHEPLLLGAAAAGQQLLAPAAAKAGLLPERSSSSGSSQGTAPGDTAARQAVSKSEQQQQQQQDVPHLPGQWTGGSLGSSSRNIRWGSVQPQAPGKPTHSPSSSNSSSSASSRSCSASYSAPAGSLDMQKTIDMESTGVDSPCTSVDMDGSTAASVVVLTPQWATTGGSSSGSGSSTTSTVRSLRKTVSRRGSTSSNNGGNTRSSRASRAGDVALRSDKLQQPAQQQKQQGCCNLIDTISHLLTAAANLAKVEGKNFVVNSPLQLDQPTTTAAPATSTTIAAPVLLPRPIRPLLVGLAASTCRRVLGYVLDVALQCTPRGGQLCVTARESSGGVELSLLHTGQVQASRLHTTSKALAPAVYGAANSGSVVTSSSGVAVSVQEAHSSSGDGGGSGGGRSSRRMQELSSSSTLRSTSSSLVSLDFASQVLQEIGGRLAVVYPCHFMNAVTGSLEVGSSIEVWLPPPAPGVVG